MSGGAPAITGIGVATGFGYGKASLVEGLLSGADLFGELTRPGRQPIPGEPAFIGVELPPLSAALPPRLARTAGLSAQTALAVLGEAWREAGLDGVDPERIGLVVGGSNLHGRAALSAQAAHGAGRRVTSPHLAFSLLDTDLCGTCTASFAIRGFAHTVGGASASGALAVIQAAEAVRSGRVDACIAIGALQDLSAVELGAFRALGVLAEPDASPGDACRPFDRRRRGFAFGEACAALVLARRGEGYGSLVGAAQSASGHRGPEPSLEGQCRAIAGALDAAGLRPRDIGAVNAHATGTPLGDDTEAAALRAAGLEGAWIQATKSVIGHGIAAAGAVELAALLLQMRAGRLHATRNLDDPIDDGLRLVRGGAVEAPIRHALSLSFGFGGIETALAVRAP